MAAAIIALLSLQLRKIRDSARIQEHLRGSMASVQALLPHSPREMRWFTAVAVSAGVCEELLYRGWMIWYFHQMMPLWLAVVAACTAFGLAHAYQGPAGIPKTGIVGAVMAAMYLLAGSLWIPMIVHALVDINGGKIGLLVFGGGKPKGDVASPAASPAMPSARESEADTTSSPARATLQHS
jgi:membrane protease YdiL (CAAX protease family)